MKSIFDSLELSNTITTKNRICRSATEEGLCDNGDLNGKVYDIYARLAEGGIGMVNSGMTEVSESGLLLPGIGVAYHDDFEDRLKPICVDMRRHNTVFNVQLAHSGFKSRGLPNPLLSPSPIDVPCVITREATKEEIRGIIKDFASAAVKAKQAGAHGVQLHNAHGYLLSAFFSPYSNRRTDEYGGSRDRRARFIFEIYDSIRAAVGDDFLVGIKTNCSDLKNPSITLDDCIWLINTLAAKGLNFAEISAGLIPHGEVLEDYIPMPLAKVDPLFYRVTSKIAEEVYIPIYSVVGWRSPTVMERCINESQIAGISMSRPFIREPALVNRWQSGDLTTAKCTSCNACEKHSAFAVYCRESPKEIKQEEWFGCFLDRK